ncbi:MAG TPA: sulfurtransferase TusA family protein [Pseudomonadales bacterium]|nr:sulfurtransferase TusA family protein [Pseudomonadales bacterium]
MQEIDVKGLACPLPLLKAKVALRDLNSGEQLRVLVTDAASVRDFAVYAELSGNRLISSSQQDDVYIHILQKA